MKQYNTIKYNIGIKKPGINNQHAKYNYFNIIDR